MAANILGWVGTVFASCLSWFESLLTGSGMLDVFLAAIGIFLIYKFLLSPLFGRAGSSDKSKKSKSNSED